MNIRLTAFLSLSLLLSLSTAPCWSRTFTSTDGRTLEGEITGKEGNTVTIRRASDGQDFTIPVETLSKPDQAEVAKWKGDAAATPGKPGNPASQPAGKSLGKITFAASKDKLSNQNTSKGGGSQLVDAKAQNWCWKVVIKNASNAPLTGLTLKYQQVVERTDRNQGSFSGAAKRVVRREGSTLTVPDIPPFGTVTVTTNGIPVLAWQSTTASRTTNTAGESVTRLTTYKWDESLSGLGVQLFQNQVQVTDWKTGTDPGTGPKR